MFFFFFLKSGPRFWCQATRGLLCWDSLTDSLSRWGGLEDPPGWFLRGGLPLGPIPFRHFTRLSMSAAKTRGRKKNKRCNGGFFFSCLASAAVTSHRHLLLWSRASHLLFSPTSPFHLLLPPTTSTPPPPQHVPSRPNQRPNAYG